MTHNMTEREERIVEAATAQALAELDVCDKDTMAKIAMIVDRDDGVLDVLRFFVMAEEIDGQDVVAALEKARDYAAWVRSRYVEKAIDEAVNG